MNGEKPSPIITLGINSGRDPSDGADVGSTKCATFCHVFQVLALKKLFRVNDYGNESLPCRTEV